MLGKRDLEWTPIILSRLGFKDLQQTLLFYSAIGTCQNYLTGEIIS